MAFMGFGVLVFDRGLSGRVLFLLRGLVWGTNLTHPTRGRDRFGWLRANGFVSWVMAVPAPGLGEGGFRGRPGGGVGGRRG